MKNSIALLATLFFVLVPSLLPRTIAGIPEKESVAFLFMFLAFYFFLEAFTQNNLKKGIIFSKKDSADIGQDFIYKILGRIAQEDIQNICRKGEIIDLEKAERIVAAPDIEKIKARSLLSCELKKGLCQKCYGWDLGKNLLINIGEAVGVIAAQAIGEPGTQLTMRIIHTGGVAGKEDIAMGLPRVQEVFEARTPRGRAE